MAPTPPSSPTIALGFSGSAVYEQQVRSQWSGVCNVVYVVGSLKEQVGRIG